MKRTFRILATVLSLALLICALPQSVLAQIGDLLNGSESQLATEETITTLDSSVYVLGEVVDSRTETSKTFRMSDGSFIAADYGKAIHYAGSDGAWEDYDNTLAFSEASTRDADDMAGYINAGNNVSIKLANNSNSNNLLKLTFGNYKVSMHLVGADKSKALEVYPALEEPTGNDIDSAATLHKFSSGAIYKDILPDVDLEYIISGSSVKENIIIKDIADSYTYTFELKLNGLIPEVDDEGNILLKDESTNETQLVIPAGYMYDANGAFSEAVTYSIAHKNGKKYTLTVTADAEWINADDRAFPISIDPTIKASTILNSDAEYICYQNDFSSGNTSPLIVSGFGASNDLGTICTVVRLQKNLSTYLPDDECRLLSASLHLKNAYVSENYSEVEIGVYELVNDTESVESNDTACSDTPKVAEIPCDTAIAKEGSDLSFDVTSIAYAWYTSDTNNEFVIKPVQESNNDTAIASFETGNQPMLLIQYDTEDYDKLGTWESYGGIGPITISANTYNGNVQLNMQDLSSNENTFGINIQHIHMSQFSNRSTHENSTYAMNLGKGWTLNLFEKIYLDYADGTVAHYDALGNKTIYSQDPERSDAHIKRYTAGGRAYFELIEQEDMTFHDGYGGKKVYDITSHKLLSITDKYGNVTNFNYSGSKLESISFLPHGSITPKTIQFSYRDNNVLTGISNCVTGESVTFEYSSTPGGSSSASATTYLKRAIYSSGKKYSYIYNSDGTVKYIMDITNDVYDREAYIQYIDRIVPIDDDQPAVSTIDLYTSKGRAAAYSFEYHSNLTITTYNGIKLYSVFDNHGNTIRQYTTNQAFASYPLETYCTTNVFRNNRLIYQDSFEGYDNTVINSYFTSRVYWSVAHGGQYTLTDMLGSSSDVMQITGDRSSIKFSVQNIPGSRLGSGTAFLLSGWVKASNSLPVDETPSNDEQGEASFGLSMVVYYSDGTEEQFRVNALSSYDDWQYVSKIVFLEKPANNIANVNVYCSYDYNTTGSLAYFDNVNLSPAVLTQYEYNDNGTLSEVSTPSNTQTYTYNNIDLITKYVYEQKDVNGEIISSKTENYSYDENKNLKTVSTNNTNTTYLYDAYGNVIKTTIQDPENNYQIVTRNSYSNYGQTLSSVTDERGFSIQYYYDSMYNLIYSTDHVGTVTRYSYDYYDETDGVYKDIVYLDYDKDHHLDTNEPYIEQSKNAVDKTKTDAVLANGIEYSFEYDVDNNVTSVGIVGISNKLSTYEYNARNQLTSETLGNGYTTSYSYDEFGRLSSLSYVDSNSHTQFLNYYYGDDGQLESIYDSATGRTQTFTYDRYDRVTRIRLTSDVSPTETLTHLRVDYEYDDFGRIKKLTEVSDDYSNTYEYTYLDDTETVLKVKINGTHQIEYEYDNLLRLHSQALKKLSGNVIIDAVEYTYFSSGSNATRYVSSVGLDDSRIDYTYDDNGNISTTYDRTLGRTTEYFYDKQGQLIRENNFALGATFIYTYDLAGNITSRQRYAGCLGPLGPVLETQTYIYGPANRLAYLNGQELSYDHAGNPLRWRNNTLAWQGSLLTSFYNVGGTSFQYDSNGLRTTKEDYATTTTTHYYYDASGNLIREQRLPNGNGVEVNILYLYDASGSIFGLTYCTGNTQTTYYFGKNLQGDVLCIYDANGTTVARYNYDAWGACTIAYDNTSIGIANKNPIRYRSYYYDKETSLYYLESRYYDPAVGRFISPDDAAYLGANGDLLSYNLYSYCSNNPVNYSDPSGHSFLLTILIGGLIGSAISGAFAVYNQVKAHGWNTENWDITQIVRSTLGGFVAGAISAIPISGWISALALGSAGSLSGGIISGSVYDLETGIQAATIGAIANLIGYGINQKILNNKAGKIFNQSRKTKSLSVQQLQAYPANMGPIALKGKYRNAFKDVSKDEIATLLKNANPLFIYGIYSSPISNLLSGWY